MRPCGKTLRPSKSVRKRETCVDDASTYAAILRSCALCRTAVLDIAHSLIVTLTARQCYRLCCMHVCSTLHLSFHDDGVLLCRLAANEGHAIMRALLSSAHVFCFSSYNTTGNLIGSERDRLRSTIIVVGSSHLRFFPSLFSTMGGARTSIFFIAF